MSQIHAPEMVTITSGAAMKIKAFSWSRYRAFKERQRVEVAPVTIIIGKNGSGKSVVSRLSVLIASAIESDARGPLNLTAGRLDHGASFQDLVNARSSLPFTLGVEITDGDKSYEFEATLRYISESRSLIVEKFVLSDGKGQLVCVEITAEEQLIAAEPRYLVSARGHQDIEQILTFNGVFPNLLGAANFDGIFEKFRSALPDPSYLGPFRAEAEHFMRTPNQDIRDLGPRGENALEMLADDRLRRGGHLAKEVQQWFYQSMGQGIEVDVTSDQPKVRVVDGSGFTVSLTDTGAGFPQSLPIVVQHFAYRSGRIQTPILIVEQPELHLHPAAHGALADLIVDTATGEEWRPATCIVETHSEQFIMRVRRRIAEQKIAPEAVKIWSLNHVSAGAEDSPPEALRVISFDANGNPDSWPVGVFEEALDDLTAMRQSIRERKK